ncbi:Tol-Pal system beta propeller repeat protein TolB [Pigmentiphaga sp.]|uniref:Tol-Pal system beta propeller repeat protein TolB n=1 Tax=Pigmentiphaga sp. TaxID=1977564 RepID=UPI00128E15A0|nr:Tol-Pal system beta propeller repeat protein TolB [Pigmentiphaga sp.]MPS29563.1 Tol-Pal system protein TolB [Alcaligenaceae bacterium SAGV5]MPS54935.1 Tol-Pal system protein TolB [Alcaligenaceae bacterium SAGV3]MPT56933.1 Tol-Pal system protein TolB [Alcaligenaceae bacterium]
MTFANPAFPPSSALSGSARLRGLGNRLGRRLLQCAAALAATAFALGSAPARAQLTVQISGAGANQYPVAIANFESADPQGKAIAEIIRADLNRTGLFRIVDAGDTPLSDSAVIGFAAWKTRGADALAVGSVQRTGDGRYDVRYRLVDTVKQAQIDGVAFASGANEMRRTAHQIADRIYEKLTGDRGIFATRIAYVLKRDNIYELQIADADGQNSQTALRSREPIISPAWSPDGTRLAYVSFESRKPVVYVHTITTGQRIPVANFKGNNSAPAWAPDGNRLAVVLTRDGLSQLYMLNADGSGLRRLTQSPGIDTEPTFTPDGRAILFTSDRGGSPQIYRLNLDSNQVERVTFKGTYNISPQLSPDGKTLLYVTRRAGFQIASLDLATGNELVLTNGGRDESPSFAPNGKMILYATSQSGRGVLAAVSSDGRVTQTLSVLNGDVREPTWGPFLNN